MQRATTPVVLDVGTFATRAGFGGDEAPKVIFPTVIGHPRNTKSLASILPNRAFKSRYVGTEAKELNGLLSLKSVMQQGVFQDCDHFEVVLQNALFDELKISPEEHPLLLSEKPWNPRENREKTIQLVFEKFNVPAFTFATDASLTMFAAGKTTGLSVNCGHDATSVTPVYEGCALVNSTCLAGYGGDHFTLDLLNRLNDRGYQLTTIGEKEIVRDMKERFFYVEEDYDDQIQRLGYLCSLEKSYELPDGSVLTVGHERWISAEGLFKPHLLKGKGEEPSLVQLIHNSIHKTPLTSLDSYSLDSSYLFSTLPSELLMNISAHLPRMLHQDLFGNIVLEGATAMMPGLSLRLSKDVKATMPTFPNFATKVWVKEAEQKNAVWVGGSIYCCGGSGSQRIIDRKEYDECGSSIVHSRFLH